MRLTKLEKAIALGTILNSIGVDDIEEYVDLETLPLIVEVLDEFHRNTTPKAKKEADVSLINKLIDDLLKRKRDQEVVQFKCISCGYAEQYTERQARTKDGLQCKHCKHGGVMINEGIQNQTTEA